MIRRLRRSGALLVLMVLLAGCGQEVANVGSLMTPTPSPPTATPPPPTATSAPPPAPPPAPTATIAPTATATPRPPATPPRPRGMVPVGWKVYTGTAVPFVIGYPPTWQIDDSRQAIDGQIVFSSADGEVGMIIQMSDQQTALTVDELRNVFAKETVKICERSGTEFTTEETIAGLVFAEVVQTCQLANQPLAVYWIGAGLDNNYPWYFIATGRYGNFNRTVCGCATSNVDMYFRPMLDTLTLYGNR